MCACRIICSSYIPAGLSPHLELLFSAIYSSKSRGLELFSLLFGSHLLYLLHCMLSVSDMACCLPAPLQQLHTSLYYQVIARLCVYKKNLHYADCLMHAAGRQAEKP